MKRIKFVVQSVVVSSKVDLKIDFCSHEAAKYACLNWHYSKCLPVGKLIKVGVWENNIYIGVVIFSRGANKSLLEPYGLKQTEGCELTRIALNRHESTVTKIMSIALKLLIIKSPDLKLVVSFADSEQGHLGIIYQAGNWIYNGETNQADEYFYNGKRWHGRAFRKTHGSHKNYIDKGLEIIKGSSKYRYLMPLNKNIRKQIINKSKDYPK